VTLLVLVPTGFGGRGVGAPPKSGELVADDGELLTQVGTVFPALGRLLHPEVVFAQGAAVGRIGDLRERRSPDEATSASCGVRVVVDDLRAAFEFGHRPFAIDAEISK
jgi:hypothetical protein